MSTAKIQPKDKERGINDAFWPQPPEDIAFYDYSLLYSQKPKEKKK